MKKETLRGLLLLFLCSGFWVLILALVASTWGIGFAQNSQGIGGSQLQPFTQAQVPPFGVTPVLPQGQMSAGPLPSGGVMGFGTSVPPMNGAPVIDNNAILPNQAQATFNTTTEEVRIPFEIDTSRLLAFSVVVDNSVQTLTVIDPINQTLLVYHIHLGNSPNAGKCELTSARSIAADLKFDNYETMRPYPSEVRSWLEQRSSHH